MKKHDSNTLDTLIQASNLILNNQAEEANQLLDQINPQDDIAKLCKQSLRERNTQVTPLYLRDQGKEDKQINVFDLVLKAVPPVQALSQTALEIMKNLYDTGVPSFTHLNIGIGKGHLEVKMLQQLASSYHEKPDYIKIIGIDIDKESLEEAGRHIKKAAQDLFPLTTVLEYIPICGFAEKLDQSVWNSIKNHGTELLGAVSAFTLHHLPTANDRSTVLHKISGCDPHLFLLIEPDVNHYSPDLTERLVNCYNLFGTIFKLVDKQKLEEREARAIKYKFFGREINDILGNQEDKRTEKHEKADIWAERLIDAGFNLHKFAKSLDHPSMSMVYEKENRFVTTEFEGIPMVAIMMASRQV
jgi:hypothetical protein